MGSHIIVDVDGLFLAMMDAGHPDCFLRNIWRCDELLQLCRTNGIVAHLVYHPLGLQSGLTEARRNILELGALTYLQYLKVSCSCNVGLQFEPHAAAGRVPTAARQMRAFVSNPST